jgi:hypothetical protein
VAAAEPEAPGPFEDPDSFWKDGEVHDLVGGKRKWRSGRGSDDTSSADGDDAMVVDLSGRRSEAAGDGGSGRRRGGRRRR